MSTAQLFAAALTVIPALLRAGAVWLVLLCGALGLAVYAVCVAVWALPSMARQAVTAAAAAARALGGPVAGAQGPEAPEALPRPGKRHAPAWAPADDQPEIEEAA